MPVARSPVRVPVADRWMGALFSRWPRLGRRLAEWETRSAELEAPLAPVARPVFVCGMARSGSTLLLRILNDAPGFTAHHYSDFPFLFTPLWWNRLRARLPQSAAAAQERAHGDRLAVTRDSPEAFEEVFWQAAFAHRHNPGVNQIMEAADRNTGFDAFYRAHIAKLLLARGATRYLAKANYHLTRLGYLHDLFPDARFVIPLREPVAQVESLVRQDRRFTELAAADPGIAAHLHRAGHREFGPGKRAVNVGDGAQAASIQAEFDAGSTRDAYAKQWSALHGWLAQRLRADPALSRACLLVSYERLCAEPALTLASVLAHAGVADADSAALIARHATGVSAPDYYASTFDEADRQAVLGDTAASWRAIRNIAADNGRYGL